MAKLDEKIGFIGGGNMAFAIASGLISRGIIKANQVLVSKLHPENAERWLKYDVRTTPDNEAICASSDIIFICVKPQALDEVCSKLLTTLSASGDKLYVSILAGVNLQKLEKAFQFIPKVRMIRVMPNTPMQVGEGCSVYSRGTNVTQKDVDKVDLILNSLGIAKEVPEKMIDPATGLTGCGPAYVFTIIEALADGAVMQGVPRSMAIEMAAQTVMGSAKAVLMTGEHPAVLRDQVCSPGGATIRGVHELEKGGIRNTLINAVEKASQRCMELGE